MSGTSIGFGHRMKFPILPNTTSGDTTVTPVSQAIYVGGLSGKCLEIQGLATELTANPVQVQATLTSMGSNKQSEWFDIGNVISFPGIFAVTTLGLFGGEFEPTILYIRLRATSLPPPQGQPPNPRLFPPSLIALIAGSGPRDWIPSPLTWQKGGG